MFLDNPILLLKKMRVNSDAIIINQCDNNQITKLMFNDHNIIVISTTERGLSKSRNLALRYSTSDIIIIADDDFEYTDNYINLIRKEYETAQHADLIIFNAEKSDGTLYKRLTRKVRGLEFYKINSIRITIKRQSLLNNSIFFDERFGAGTRFNLGEDTLFIDQCRKNKLIILSSNIIICKSLNYRSSTWFSGYNKEYFYNLGAFYKHLSPKLYRLMILYFAITKYALYKNEVKFIHAIKCMKEGSLECIK